MAGMKTSAVAIGAVILVVAFIAYRYAAVSIDLSSGGGQAFTIIFFLVIAYFVYRAFTR